MAMYAAAVDISRLFQEEPKCSCQLDRSEDHDYGKRWGWIMV
jgi:hypothetical protein